jgi:hypothetical protein
MELLQDELKEVDEVKDRQGNKISLSNAKIVWNLRLERDEKFCIMVCRSLE